LCGWIVLVLFGAGVGCYFAKPYQIHDMMRHPYQFLLGMIALLLLVIAVVIGVWFMLQQTVVQPIPETLESPEPLETVAATTSQSNESVALPE